MSIEVLRNSHIHRLGELCVRGSGDLWNSIGPDARL